MAHLQLPSHSAPCRNETSATATPFELLNSFTQDRVKFQKWLPEACQRFMKSLRVVPNFMNWGHAVAVELQEVQEVADGIAEAEYVRPKVAAEILGITERQIYNKAKDGSLPSRKIDRRLHVAVAIPQVRGVAREPASELQEAGPGRVLDRPESDSDTVSELLEVSPAISELPELAVDPVSEVQEASPDAHAGNSAAPYAQHTAGSEDTLRNVEAELKRVSWERDLLAQRNEELREDRDATREEFHHEREKWSGVVQQYSEEKERLLLLLSNEQALRLPSLEPSPTEQARPVNDPRPPEDAPTSVTIRGSNRRGWLSRVFGAK